MTSFVKKKACERDVVGIVTFDRIGLLPTNHIIAYNYLKFHCHKIKSTRNGKLGCLSGRFQTVIWRLGETVQNLESPRLSGRVDSSAIQWHILVYGIVLICFQIVIISRVLSFLLVFFFNALMWTLFVKSLRGSSSSATATVTNTGSNFICTVSTAILCYLDKHCYESFM